MIQEKKIGAISVIGIAIAAVISMALFIYGNLNSEEQAINRPDASDYLSTDYVTTLFDDSYVHTINVIVSDLNWSYMIENAGDEQYVLCDVEIDGELIKNVALRPKGNSSLASIAHQGSEHFSYKMEFDHYTANGNYHGLDKLSLNNLGQDKSCMKDYFAYHMMNEMGVAAPLSSYALVQVNGEDFGLYLAVEAIEDSFCYRNYGEDFGELYRPDAFAIDTISVTDFKDVGSSDIFKEAENPRPHQRLDILGQVINLAFADCAEQVGISAMNYVDDKKDTYSAIFDTSVFRITDEDKERMVEAIRRLNSDDNPTGALELDSVMRYFAVHTFVNNYDSYQGVFVHNFYVHEKDGKLSMVPWDYNLAFGGFSVQSAYSSLFGETKYGNGEKLDLGMAMDDDTSFVNYPIDTPLYSVSMEDRPMIGAWIDDEELNSKYHEIYDEFISVYFESGKYASEYEKVKKLITPYINDGMTFYSKEVFEEGACNFNLYNELRAESIRGQLDGRIPTTFEGQEENFDSLVKIGDLNLGKTIDFSGLAWGVTSKDIEDILDALSDGNASNAEELTEYIAYLTVNRGELGGAIKRVLTGSSLIGGAIESAAITFAALTVSVIALIIALKVIKRYRRR